MLWKLRLPVALGLFILIWTVISAFVSFLSKLIAEGSLEAAFAQWPYRTGEWKVVGAHVGAATVVGLVVWLGNRWLERRLLRKRDRQSP